VRFQTRLTIGIGLLVMITIVVMAGVVIRTGLDTIERHYGEMGLMEARLAARLVEETVGFPERLLEQVSGNPAFRRRLAEQYAATGRPAEEVQAWLDAMALALRDVVAPPRGRGTVRRMLLEDALETLLGELSAARIIVFDANGMMAAASKVGSPVSAGSDAKAEALWAAFRETPDAMHQTRPIGTGYGVITRITLPVGEPPQALFLLLSTEEAYGMVHDRIAFVSAFTAIMLVVAVGLSLVLSRGLSRPLADLATGVSALGRGQLGQRIALPAKLTEIQTLQHAFNDMAASLEVYVTDLAEETRRRERAESELRIAAELQQALLPTAPPEVAGLDIAGTSVPARASGGDFFDYLDFGGGRWGVVIGDATDKGLPAALLATQCWSALRAVAAGCIAPGALLDRTNVAISHQTAGSGRFVTLFLAVFDADGRHVHFASGGHNPPLLLRRGGTVEWLSSRTGLPIGIAPDAAYSEHTVVLHPGDVLVFYTDGVTEAHSGGYGLFGTGRLTEAIRACHTEPANAMLAAVADRLGTHMDGQEPPDDWTLVIVRIHEPPQSSK